MITSLLLPAVYPLLREKKEERNEFSDNKIDEKTTKLNLGVLQLLKKFRLERVLDWSLLDALVVDPPVLVHMVVKVHQVTVYLFAPIFPLLGIKFGEGGVLHHLLPSYGHHHVSFFSMRVFKVLGNMIHNILGMYLVAAQNIDIIVLTGQRPMLCPTYFRSEEGNLLNPG